MAIDLTKALGAWYPALQPLFAEPWMIHIGNALARDEPRLQPALPDVFRALELTPPKAVKVVIIGQDPYPGGQADGLAFSCGKGGKAYALSVIYEELERDGFGLRKSRTLEDWASQGILLLNRSLTTVLGMCGGHHDIGWEKFTGVILGLIAANVPNMVFMVWGSSAKDSMQEYVLPVLAHRTGSVCILYAPHPSAQRHGYDFIGCSHFSKCNQYLSAHGKQPIIWNPS